MGNVVDSADPFHLIFCFELFCYAFLLCHLFYQPKKPIFSLPINIGKVAVQLFTCQQIDVIYPFVLTELPQVFLLNLSVFMENDKSP